MKKLRFPIIKKTIPSAKWLSMDDYLKFVSLNVKYTLKRKLNKKWQRLLVVNVPFSLK